MPADRLLNTVLQRYQHVHGPVETDQIIGTTAHLLSRLSNPLNLGVLTSQLLTAPAIWHRQDGPRLSLRIVGIYRTAASRVRDNDTDDAKHKEPGHEGGLRCDEWARAVIKGADDRSRRWQHLLVLTGVLVGMEGDGRRSLSWSLRSALEQAIVTATNPALEHTAQDGLLASASLVTALNFAFPLLSDGNRSRINCSALLPIAVWAFTGDQGFCDGQFLKAIGNDTTENASHLLSYPANSPAYRMLQELEKQPLMANIGPLSKLAGFAVQHARDSAAVLQAQDALLVFTGRVLSAWQRIALSGVDPDFEGTRMDLETLQTTWPHLWQVLRKLMFGSVAVLQAIVSRSLLDPNMLANGMAPGIAAKSLHVLRNLFFISSRNGNNAFQVYTFSYLTSLDVLSRDPATCQVFLRETRAADVIPFPASFLQRTLDLFHLNVAEHLPLALSASSCQNLIIEPAVAYLSHNGSLSPSGVELFESAHSAILSVLSCPQHSPLTIDITPFYIVKLFESFPHHISPRQFRVAFKTVMEIVSPPFPIAAMRPELSETLLEMLRCNIPTASTALLGQNNSSSSQQEDVPLSEQSALVMALVDSLPFLPLVLVEDWLGITAQMMKEIADPSLRGPVMKRFLDVLVNGEMDVERSTIGVAWWGTKGGREAVLLGSTREPTMMSGAIGGANEKSSRL
ncbi:peroxin 8 [Hirsutella rhossiliensis]|uniref:Peroxin 8 n=1 Tax=Hirsutella rhossiliensis TaxID=111463 RepID=A0A9P8SK28_9HYPO|nr:peroxin 8 [Hirsutella rhossiliensis]KAH0965913.1 peroxin 8 [Hirsutella rhossiliensis]